MGDGLGHGLVIAGQRVEPHIDAGGQHQTVVVEDRAVVQPDLPGLGIDAGGVLVDDGDALGPDLVIAELLAVHRRATRSMTALLIGQETYVGLRSISATSRPWRFRKRAQVAPAKPPPITTTLGVAWAKAWPGERGGGDAEHQRLQNRAAVRGWSTHGFSPQRCWTIQAAMSRISCSVKPLDMRSMTVGDPCPARYSSMAAAISSADLALIAGMPPAPAMAAGAGGRTRRLNGERGRLLRQSRPA